MPGVKFTNLLDALLWLVHSLFFHDPAEVTEGKDGGRPNVVLQVVGAEPGLKKKVGPVRGPPASKQCNLHRHAHRCGTLDDLRLWLLDQACVTPVCA